MEYLVVWNNPLNQRIAEVFVRELATRKLGSSHGLIFIGATNLAAVWAECILYNLACDLDLQLITCRKPQLLMMIEKMLA